MSISSWFITAAAWFLAPLLIGVINKVKAFFSGRTGQPVFQLYRDLFKLLGKGTVYSRTSSVITRITPPVVLASVLIATLFVPWGAVSSPCFFSGDIIVLAYLLGLSRFFTVLVALDAGSSFEGMGASREVQLGMLVEPSIFLGVLVLVLYSGQMTVSSIFSNLFKGYGIYGAAPLLLVAFSWSVALLTENSRIPVDDPNTHLELTMIHEVMILDLGGADFGIMLYASSLKLWIFSALLANLLTSALLSGNQSVWINALLFLASMLSVSSMTGVIESVMARLRFSRIPKLLISSCALGTIALIIMVLGTFK